MTVGSEASSRRGRPSAMRVIARWRGEAVVRAKPREEVSRPSKVTREESARRSLTEASKARSSSSGLFGGLFGRVGLGARGATATFGSLFKLCCLFWGDGIGIWCVLRFRRVHVREGVGVEEEFDAVGDRDEDREASHEAVFEAQVRVTRAVEGSGDAGGVSGIPDPAKEHGTFQVHGK